MQIIGVSQANSNKSLMSILRVLFDQGGPDFLGITRFDREQIWFSGRFLLDDISSLHSIL